MAIVESLHQFDLIFIYTLALSLSSEYPVLVFEIYYLFSFVCQKEGLLSYKDTTFILNSQIISSEKYSLLKSLHKISETSVIVA